MSKSVDIAMSRQQLSRLPPSARQQPQLHFAIHIFSKWRWCLTTRPDRAARHQFTGKTTSRDRSPGHSSPLCKHARHNLHKQRLKYPDVPQKICIAAEISQIRDEE
jgi:hypothetical protein